MRDFAMPWRRRTTQSTTLSRDNPDVLGKSLELLCEEARRQLEMQLSFIDAIDNKLTQTFAVGSAEIAAVAAVLALNATLLRAQIVFLIAAVTVYVALAAISMGALWTREWHVGPTWRDLAALHQTGHTANEITAQATRRFVTSFESNRGVFSAKAWMLRIALLLLAAETATVVLAVFRAAVLG